MLLDTLLPSYIFRQQMMIHIILIIVCTSLFSAAVILFFIKIKIAQAKSLHIGRMLLAVTSIVLLYFLIFFPELKNTLDLRSNDAAVTGAEFNGTKYVAKFWKNGVATTLTNGLNDAGTYSIFVK